jgi:hypothetical protein
VDNRIHVLDRGAVAFAQRTNTVPLPNVPIPTTRKIRLMMNSLSAIQAEMMIPMRHPAKLRRFQPVSRG